MADLRKMDVDLLLAKYELSPGNYTAQFKGGALVLAEDMIKKRNPVGATLIESSGSDLAPHLEGLSCRLMPLKSRNGIILSILAKPKGPQSEQILREILAELKKILNGDFLSARPVSSPQLSWKWPPASFFSEIKTQKQNHSEFSQWLQTGLRGIVSALVLTFNIPLGSFKPKIYKSELISNSDFKKFDETLRMVIDCSLAQASEIESLLNHQRQKNGIAFGTHRSSNALMTCIVKSTTNNQHIHFIDGADGGYTLAAANMKASELNSEVKG